MNISPAMILMLIGAILLLISSVVSPAAIDLFKLGWGFVVLGYILSP